MKDTTVKMPDAAWCISDKKLFNKPTTPDLSKREESRCAKWRYQAWG